MKKTLAVLLAALVLITGVSAAGIRRSSGPEMMLGVRTGWGMDMAFPENTDAVTNSSIPVKADFMVSLDAPVSFSASLGTDIKIFPHDYADDRVYGTFAVDLAGFYRYDINRKASVLAGLGFGWDFYSTSAEVLKTRTTTNVNTFSLFLDCRAVYAVSDHISVLGGLTAGGDIAQNGSVTVKVGESSRKGDFDGKLTGNFSFGLSAGASWKF